MIRIASSGTVGSYLHNHTIGALVALQPANDSLGKDIAMHIAANKPIAIDSAHIPVDLLTKEREIYVAQARDSGKSLEIINKMVDGRLNKFIDEMTLLGQPYVKNPEIKVKQLLKEQHVEIKEFMRFEVGEGIEKKAESFID